MALSNERVRNYVKRLLLARMRILNDHGFYGLLMMHMQFALDENCETASTDGVKIYFGPEFLDEIGDSELEFVMMHEILHVILQHCLRQGERDHYLFNIACDIVVNSNILLSNNMNRASITLKKYGEAMHLAPDGKEGHQYTAEQVYSMLVSHEKGGSSGISADGGSGRQGNSASGNSKDRPRGNDRGKVQNGVGNGAGWDDHSRWGTALDDGSLKDVWVKRFRDACEAISIRDPSNSRGLMPLFADRLFKELKNPQTDWRSILNDFVQEEVTDYSFTPPDRRFGDSPFFLPDFNDKGDMVEDILFMIDTSGSMSDDMITAAYSEVKGAIDQFNGRLKGWLGFFDAAVVEPKLFESEEEFKVIKASGGGGTSFQVIFDYARTRMQEKPPASIIILTDGYAPFPKESAANGIPVLWLLNNEKVTPPWGKIARIKV